MKQMLQMDSNRPSLSPLPSPLLSLPASLPQDVLYSFPASATSMAVHPLSPCYIAFALGDGSVRLLDRRMTKNHVGNIDLPNLADKAMVKQYKPHTIGTQPHKITSVQFNTVGSELLVSYSEDYVYLFSNRLFHAFRDTAVMDSSAFLSRPVYLSQLERYSPSHRRNRSSFVKRKPLSNHGDSPPPTPPSSKPAPKVDSVPPAKKLRLRGDWSDTGPEARPEVDSEGGEGGGEEGGGGGREGGRLMNRMSRMFAQWIDMSLNPDPSSSSSSNHGAVPSRYRHRRSRRVPPPTHRDGASPSASSATSSSNDSFQLFDSDSNEAEVEEGEGERGEERGESESREHPATLDSKEDDIFPVVVESPNGAAVKSEGVVTMDASTVSERSTPPSPDLAEVGEKKVLLSPIELQNSDTRSDTERETSSVVDTEATFTLSDGEREKSSDSRDSKNDFRTQDATSSPMHESEGEQNSQVEGSVASNVTVTIESRTKNSSPDSAPAVVVEGQTDSDDTCEEDGSCDESHDSQKRSHDDGLLCSQYFMRYKGHRNSRTMVHPHEIVCISYDSLSLSLPLPPSLSFSLSFSLSPTLSLSLPLSLPSPPRSSRPTSGERTGY